MDRQILEDIATDAALLSEYMAQRGVPEEDVPVITAGAMSGIVAYETAVTRRRGRYGQVGNRTLETRDDPLDPADPRIPGLAVPGED
jgi:hypothetical protein